jgi:cellulose synthase/poly-beta-1,6-N-acetylglucosamine synthase-like glycosyltransferase
MSTNTPIVSVLMTSYNREAYIEQAIQSVLASDLTDFELIICDDCSLDATVEIARKYASIDARVRVFEHNQNIGDYPNRNRAASYALGKYIKYLDSDDAMYPHTLSMMVNCMEQFPEAGFGLSSMPEPSRVYPVLLEPQKIYWEHFFGFGHFDRAPGSAIIKKSVFDDVGGFSGKRMIGDYEMWFTLARKYSMVKYPRELVWTRHHAGQEFQSAYAKQYPVLKKQVLDTALLHADCPLNQLQIKQVQRKIFLDNFKHKIQHLFSSFWRSLAS